MLERYRGANANLLIDAIRAQPFVEGNLELATQLAQIAVLEEVGSGHRIMEQDGSDNDLVLIITGAASVYVHQRKVAERKTGQHVGEMALIDVTARRSATVIADEETVIARISERRLSEIADSYPRVWRLFAVEIATRLRERGKFIKAPNPKPHVFIGSSSEALGAAQAVESGLPHEEFVVRLWTSGVFEASKTTIESLEQLMKSVDFAALVFSPDDQVFSRGAEHQAPRDNVIFELGLAMGALNRDRSFIVRPRGSKLKIPTDLLGVTCITYEPGEPEAIPTRLAPACEELTAAIRKLGPR